MRRYYIKATIWELTYNLYIRGITLKNPSKITYDNDDGKRLTFQNEVSCMGQRGLETHVLVLE